MYKKYCRLKEIKILKKKKKKKKKEGKKQKTPQNFKSPTEAVVYNNSNKCDRIYTYTYTPISKIKSVQQK